MDSAISINSLKGYSRVLNDHHLRRNNIKNKIKSIKPSLLLFVISSILLVAVVIGAVSAVGALINNNINTTKSTAKKGTPSSSSSTPDDAVISTIIKIKTICSVTHYPNSCVTSLLLHQEGSSGGGGADLHDVEGIFKLSLSIALEELSNLTANIPLKLNKKTNSNYNFNYKAIKEEEDRWIRIETALRDCRSLVEDCVDKLETSISSMETEDAGGHGGGGTKATMMKMLSSPSKINDIRTWLSGALTDQDTCLDSLDEFMDDDPKQDNYNLPEETKTAMKMAREYTSNSLAIVSNLPTILRDLHLLHR